MAPGKGQEPISGALVFKFSGGPLFLNHHRLNLPVHKKNKHSSIAPGKGQEPISGAPVVKVCG